MRYGMNGYERLEPESRRDVKEKYWAIAFGLQEVDALKPSEYVKKLSKKNIEGELTNREIETQLYAYYDKHVSPDVRDKECDIVSNRIVELLEMEGFPFVPSTLKSIHRYLFHDIYENAGEYRTFNISKKEEILYGDTVRYCNYFMIEDTLQYDFEQEIKRGAVQMSNPSEAVKRLTAFTSAIWQVHPFSEGNTRTTAVFIERYLNSLGYRINNELFKEHAVYFRNALVRSNYAVYPHGIRSESGYLMMFFENLLTTKQNDLTKVDMKVTEIKELKELPNTAGQMPGLMF